MEENKKSWFRRHPVWSTIFGVIIFFFLIGIFFGGETNVEQNKAADNQMIDTNINAQKQINTVPKEVKTYSLGDEIQAGDFKWKIIKSSTTEEIGQDLAGTFLGEKADGIFLILDVEIENTGKTAQYLSDSFIKLVDDQSREFSANTAAAFYLRPTGSALMFEQINPGIKKKGKIVYDVPAGLKVANIRVSSNLLESSFYNINLII